MFLDHPAAKIVLGVGLGGLVGVLAFEAVSFQAAPHAPADIQAQAPVPVAAVVPAAPRAKTDFLTGDAPVSAPGGPRLLASKPLSSTLLTGATTIPCATRSGGAEVNVGWALSVFGDHPSGSARTPGSSSGRGYATSVAWGPNALSLAVSCSPSALPVEPRARVAEAVPASSAGGSGVGASSLEYPPAGPSLGVQISGLFKPATDAMP
jgi:hypothetical protein